MKAVAVQSWGCLRLKEAGAANETTAVRARRHSASCLIPNQSSERRRAAVMRRPTKRLSHKSQMSRALQHKPPGRGRSVKTECKRGKVDFCSLAHVTVFPTKRLRLLSLSHCVAAFLECHRLQDAWHSVIVLTSSWDQFGGKKAAEGRPVCSERSR